MYIFEHTININKMIDNKVFLYKQIIQEERDITNKKKQLKDEFSKYIRNYEKNKDSSLYLNRKNKQSVTGKVGENIIHSYNLSRSLPINKRIYKSIITEEESNQDLWLEEKRNRKVL